MKKIKLEMIQKQHGFWKYETLYEHVMAQIKANQLKPVLASGTNGKKPALYNSYWIVEAERDDTALREELQYRMMPAISVDYYLRHLAQYAQDRQWVLMLNTYLRDNREKLEQPESINERSFEIWQREKFLKQELGKRILSRCGIAMSQLNLYETTEPLAYYTSVRTEPQNILILENKDTFYSMRKHLLDGKKSILGCEVQTLIYGAGKGIFKSFQDFALCAEPYLQHPENKLYYFGDLDYEGIGIYERLAEIFAETGQIVPFVNGYAAMLRKYETGGLQLPRTKEKQNRNIQGFFFEAFSPMQQKQMQEILEQDFYIPQEILNIHDL